MSRLPANLRNSLGRKSSLFASSLGRLPWSSQTSQRGPKLYKLPSLEESQVLFRSSTRLIAIWRQFPSQASTCFSLVTWKLEVLAAPIFLRSLSQILLGSCLCASSSLSLGPNLNRDSRRLGLYVAKASLVSSQRYFVTPGYLKLHNSQLSRRKLNKLIAPRVSNRYCNVNPR